MISIKVDELTDENRKKLDDLIRASIYDIVRSDEMQHLIDDGIFNEVTDVLKMKQDAAIILPHIFNARYKKRVASNSNADNFQCRKTNNLKMIPDNTNYYYIKLPNEHTFEYMNKLIHIGIVEPTHIVDGVPAGEYKSDFKKIPTRHIPTTNTTHDFNISPVKGYTFSQLRSM